MTKEEAIKRCREEADKYGDIFGNWNVIMANKTYEAVSDEYLKSYRHFGKIYHTEIATEPVDVDIAESAMKDILLTFCSTRKDRRLLERKLKAGGGITGFFKRFKR